LTEDEKTGPEGGDEIKKKNRQVPSGESEGYAFLGDEFLLENFQESRKK
jgi:hypothetical protein